MSVIRIDGLTKRFGDGNSDRSTVAVDNLALEVEDGEFLTLLGPSGCGKTTTLRCLAGLETPDEGEISIDGTLMFSSRRHAFVPPEKRNCGMVFQSYALWPHMRVFSNVAYPLKRARNIPQSEIKSRVATILEAVGLKQYANRFPTELSGGQQQRVSLARALVARPRLVLLDEPLSNLDAKLRAEMRIELRNLHRQFGTTMVYVTHDQTEAMVMSDRVVVMESGKIQQMGRPHEIYTRPTNTFVADFVGFENIISGEVHTAGDDHFIARMGTDGPLLRCVARTPPPVGDPVHIAIRGSSFSLSSQPLTGENTFAAEIEETTYLGGTIEYRVRAGDVRLEVSTHQADITVNNGHIGADRGSTVYLAVRPDQIVHGLAAKPGFGPGPAVAASTSTGTAPADAS